MPFDQYEQRGAYHWNALNRPWWRFGGYPARLAARYRLVLQRLPHGGPRRVLDIGCGDGALTHMIAQRGYSVIGLDPELAGVRLALQLALTQTRVYSPVLTCGSAYALPFENQAVEIIVMADVIEHLERPRHALSEAHRVLKPGGQLIVSTPQRWPGKTRGRYHFQEFTATELTELLASLFVKVEVTCSESLFWYKLYRHRLAGRRTCGFIINVLSAIGFNPFLLSSRQPSLRYGQLTAVAWKESSL